MRQQTANHGMSRRDFVTNLSAAGVAVAGLSLARSAHAAGSDQLRIGMIGCG
jgi:myo-inositol 2-dehydrogenase / D-chiro-inositol 1-dehydrogenase